MDTIEIFLQGKGISGIVLVELASNGAVRDIITVAAEHGFKTAEDDKPMVWIEEVEEPLCLDLSLAEAKITHHSRVHVHTCHVIEVTVVFNGQSRAHRFPPSATVGKVKTWAGREFHLSEADAAEHVLQVTGTTAQPTEDVHIGSLVQSSHCSLGFDLIPKQRIQG
jgi:hypothetical protein